MKLKLKGAFANPAAARASGHKMTFDHYRAFVCQLSGHEVEAREIGVEMLEQFMASDRDFQAMAEAGAEERFRVAREPDLEKPSDGARARRPASAT